MTFPTVATRSSGGSGTSDVTSHPITLPSGIVAGDLLIVFFSIRGIRVITKPADWILYDYNDRNGNVTGGFWYKWATGGDTLTLTTDTGTQSTHICYRITNGGVPNASWVGGTSTNTDPPAAFTFQTDDFLVLVSRHGSGTTVATAVGGSLTNMQTKAASGTNGVSTNTAERTATITAPAGAAGSLDPAAFTSASTDWVSWTVLIPVPITTTQYLLDSFSSALGSNWDSSDKDTGTIAQTSGGVLQLITPAGSGGYVSANWVPVISLQPGQIYGAWCVTFSDRGDEFGSGTAVSVESYPAQIYLRVPDGDPTPAAGYLWSNGNINDEFDVDGLSRIDAVDWATPPIIYADRKYYGIGRNTNGDLMWVYSPDGKHFRRHLSRAWPSGWNANAVGFSIIHGQYNVETNADKMIVDDFSLWVINGTLPNAHVRRSGSTVVPTSTKVRRSGAWVTPTAVKVRRSGAWVTPT